MVEKYKMTDPITICMGGVAAVSVSSNCQAPAGDPLPPRDLTLLSFLNDVVALVFDHTATTKAAHFLALSEVLLKSSPLF
jgi:hypothetical protein